MEAVRKLNKKTNRKYLCLVIPIVIILIWHLVSVLNLVNSILLPSPARVFSTLFKLVYTGQVLPDVAMTLTRVFIAFVLAAAIGIPLGILMGYSMRVYNYLEFLVDFFIAMPHIALFPLFLLLFGVGDESKIMVTVLASSLFMSVNTMYGIRYANKLRIITAKTMKTKKLDMFRKVMIPEAMPYIFAGLKIALSFSLILIIATEMLIGTNIGLGYRIINAELIYQTSEMYALIILTGFIGYLLNKISLIIEKRVIYWNIK